MNKNLENTSAPQENEWEKEARKFLWQFVGHDTAAHTRIDGTMGDCAGCKYDLDAVIAYIRSLLASKRAELEKEIRHEHTGFAFEAGKKVGRAELEEEIAELRKDEWYQAVEAQDTFSAVLKIIRKGK